MLTLDIETADDSRLVCVGWQRPASPVQSSPTLPASLRAALADVNEVVVTHSGYDVRFLHAFEGVDVKATMHDTQVMAWLVNENTPLDLAFCANRYLGVTLDKTLQKQAGTAPYADVAAYCEKDVSTTLALYFKLKERLLAEGLWDYFDTTEAPFTGVLREMEFRGLPVDLTAASTLAQGYRATAKSLEAKLTIGLPSAFNVRSPQHVGKLLASKKFTIEGRVPKLANETNRLLDALSGQPPVAPEDAVPGTFVTEKSARVWDHGYWVVQGRGHGALNAAMASVSKPDLLDSVQLSKDPWVKDYLEYKKLDKLLGTYLDVFAERAVNGRIHGRFNQTGTTTGRLSSSEPNLQNIPSKGTTGAEIRELFRGNLVVGDFSQLEPRLMAHFSRDPYMMNAFRSGLDLYMEIAGRVGCSRGTAKTLVLAMSYGAGPEKVAQTLRLNGNATTASLARSLLVKLQQEYNVYFNWRESVIAESKRQGSVQTIDGRLRRLSFSNTKNAIWKDPAAPGRQAANAVVQGSAADIMRRVMLHTARMFPNLKLLAQVHDELVFEVSDKDFGNPDILDDLEKWVLKIAQRGVSVPLEFKPHYGHSWFQAKEGLWTP